MSDITVELDALMEDYDHIQTLTFNTDDDLKNWAMKARKAIERAKNEFMGED